MREASQSKRELLETTNHNKQGTIQLDRLSFSGTSSRHSKLFGVVAAAVSSLAATHSTGCTQNRDDNSLRYYEHSPKEVTPLSSRAQEHNPARKDVHEFISKLRSKKSLVDGNRIITLEERFTTAGSTFQDTLAQGGEGPKMSVVMPMTGNRKGTIYLVSQSVVSNRQYAQFAESTGRDFSYGNQRSNAPVTGLQVEEMLAYCAWLSLQTDQEYRLPRSTEWLDIARQTSDKNGGNPWGLKGLADQTDELAYHSDQWGTTDYRVLYGGSYEQEREIVGHIVIPKDDIVQDIGGKILIGMLGVTGAGIPDNFLEAPNIETRFYEHIQTTIRADRRDDAGAYFVTPNLDRQEYIALGASELNDKTFAPRTVASTTKLSKGLIRYESTDLSDIGFRVVSPIDPSTDFPARITWDNYYYLRPDAKPGQPGYPALFFLTDDLKVGDRQIYHRGKRLQSLSDI